MARLVLISLLHGLLLAQTPPAAFDPLGDSSQIAKGLQSAMPLQVAISAFRSVKINDQQRGEWLRDALTRSSWLQPETEAVRARRAIFDALIRTRTPVPLTELLPFFDQFPAAVIAIVAKGNSSEREDRLPLLLKAEEGKNSTYWYAAASLLDRKQLVHYLVKQARFDYAISVLDQDFVPVQVRDGPPRGLIGGIIGGVLSAPPSGPQVVTWPEETVYHIEMSGDSDHVLTCCIGGNTYLKVWSPSANAVRDPQPADPRAWEDHDRDVVRVLLSIAHCVYCSVDRGDFLTVRGGRASIVWHSLEQAHALLEEAVEHYVKECVWMVGALGETLSESEIRSKVRIWIRDWRRVRTTPIPSVGAGVEFNRCASIQSSSSNGRCID